MDFNTGFKKNFVRPTLRHWLLSAKVRAYGSGRAAIVDISRHLSQQGIRRLWLPAWQCDELVVSLKEAGFVEIEFYCLADDLFPERSFLSRLDPEQEALLVVDFFASTKGDDFESILRFFSGFIMLDAVHSWLIADLAASLRDNVFVISGFRKLFWKATGALVTGGFVSLLPVWPALITKAAPNFPRNMSLAPRFGLFTKLLLRIFNLEKFDQLALTWQPQSTDRGILEALRSPVQLIEGELLLSRVNQFRGRVWEWPHLYSLLQLKEKENALGFKYHYRVIFRNSGGL